MRKVKNMSYETGCSIVNHLIDEHGKHNVKLVKSSEATHIYLYKKYFDTFDNRGKSGGYMLKQTLN